MNYYRHEVLSKRVIRIIDFLDVCCYLVIGDQKACLLDTINGFGNILEYAKQFTDKPIFTILTHGHIDHAAGASLFDEVYMHHNDISLMNEHCNMHFRVNRYQKQEQTKNIPLKDYNPLYEGIISPLKDDQEFDLGNITIHMILCKGHTQGMMVPLIKEERMIVFGDACGVGVLLFGEHSSCVSEYRNSLIHLKEYESQYDIILRNHGTFSSDKDLLNNVIECCDDILNGKASGQIIHTHGIDFYSTKQVDENGNRVDGKFGNIKYVLDKAH